MTLIIEVTLHKRPAVSSNSWASYKYRISRSSL